MTDYLTFVKKLSKLAAVRMSDEQVAAIEPSFKDVMEYMDRIKNLDTSTVIEDVRPAHESNNWREDVVTPSLSQETATANAKKTIDGFFVVPYLLKNKKMQ